MMARRSLARAHAAALLTLLVLVGGPAAIASAAPGLAIQQPLSGSFTKSQLPLFAGTSEDEGEPVTVEIYEGPAATGMPSIVAVAAPPSEGAWSVTPEAPLAAGEYTAVAKQESITSEPVTFTVDTTAPAVTIDPVSSPTNDNAPTLSGEAGTEPGDIETVTVTIYKGETVGGEVAASGEAITTGASWAYKTPAELPDGIYTAVAAQEDQAGNLGTSQPPVTFTVDTTPPALTIGAPAEGAVLSTATPTLSGLAGSAAGDQSSVKLKIYAGKEVSGSAVSEFQVNAVAGSWGSGSSSPTLGNGIYTLQAQQSDSAGNTATRTTTFAIAAASPLVTLDTGTFAQRAGVFYAGATPTFSGSASTAPEDSSRVTIEIHSGTSTAGALIASAEGVRTGSSWQTKLASPLAQGTYTAVAQQQDSAPSTPAGESAPVTFTVDTQAPQITLTSPADNSSTSSSSQALGGAAGTAAGDSSTITVQLYAGTSTVGQSPLHTIAVQASAGVWSAAFAGLSPGTYSAIAEQSDDVGNVGHSTPVTFTVTAPPASSPPAPPTASFQWFPTSPRVGEQVSLVSTSSDHTSPLTAFAWSAPPSNVFAAGGNTRTTTFATPGPHVVQLRVTNAAGLASVASNTITVTSPTATLMQPFPVVSIAGSEGAVNVKITLLSVQAPIGASVTVGCSGGGCPVNHRVTLRAGGVGNHHSGAVLITFKRFQRTLRPGAVLQITVSQAGFIGKYTRFTIRRNRPPSRQDACVAPGTGKRMACP
jgi:hypothetical protein